MGVVVKDGAMHFYQMLPYICEGDGHQTPVPVLDDLSNIVFPDESPEGLYDDVIQAIRKLNNAGQYKGVFELDPEGHEELLPPAGEKWKPLVVTRSDEGGIVFHDLTDYKP